MTRVIVLAMAFWLNALSSVANAADTVLILISHEVADFGEWKKRFDAGKVNREKAGLKERHVLRDAGKPSAVIAVLEARSVEDARKFATDAAFNDRVRKASSTGSADIKIGTTSPTGK